MNKTFINRLNVLLNKDKRVIYNLFFNQFFEFDCLSDNMTANITYKVSIITF